MLSSYFNPIFLFLATFFMRRFALSDIHGCLQPFKTLITHHIELQKDDQLFLLGDYIDRGPDSKGVIDFIMELQAGGYQVQCLMGNHEQMMLNAYDGTFNIEIWRANGGDTAEESFGATLYQLEDKYLQFFRSLQYYVELDDYLLVHAGFDFRNPDIFADKHAMVWIRNWYHQIKPNVINNRTIVHGHTPMSIPNISKLFKAKMPFIDIDGGCTFGGALCAIDLDTPKIHCLGANNQYFEIIRDNDDNE